MKVQRPSARSRASSEARSASLVNSDEMIWSALTRKCEGLAETASRNKRQNIPRAKGDKFHIRECFVSPFGKTLVDNDYDQLEMKLMAHFSGDEKMVGAINAGMDLHCYTVSLMFGAPYDDVFAAKKAKEPTPEQELLLLMRQSAKCVHPDTLVFTKNLLPLSQSMHFGGIDEFCEVRHIDVADGTGRQLPVEAAYNGGIKPLLHVVSRRGILTCSHNHQFALADGTLKRAIELTVGDLLLEAEVPPLINQPYPLWKRKITHGVPATILPLDHNTSYFAGLFLGDGCKSTKHSYSFAHGPVGGVDATGLSYSDWQDHLYNSAAIVGFDSLTRHHHSLYLGSRHTGEYLEALGLLQDNQRRLRVPTWVLIAGFDATLHFLGGLIDTDGTVDKNTGGVSITTKDAVFAGQLATVIRACGLNVAMEPCWNTTYQKYYYRVRVTASSGMSLHDYIRHPGKRARLRTINKLTQQPNKVLALVPSTEGPCLDLQVSSKNHLYLTNGLITHNSVGFGLIYGIGAVKLAQQLTEELKRVVTKDEAQANIKRYFAAFPGVERFIKGTHEYCKQTEFVQTLVGRFRRLPMINARGGGKSEEDGGKGIAAQARRQAVNAIIQGTAADIAKAAMIKAEYDPELNSLGAQLLLQIHDELILEVEDNKEIVELTKKRLKTIMEDPFDGRFPLLVPLTVGGSHGHTWASAK